MENLEPPAWADVDQQVATSGVWQTLNELPSAAALVLRLAWDAAPRLTLLAGIVQLASGCASAFGLFATAGAFTDLLTTGPTPDRVVAALPAVGLVVAAFSIKALLETAVTAVQGALMPRVHRAAQDELNSAVAEVDLLAWEDPDFRELQRQGGNRGVQSVETSVRNVTQITSALVTLAAALITAGLLNPWLLPVLLLPTAAEAWASMRAAKQGYTSFLNLVTRRMRLHVAENLLVARDIATERRALNLQDSLLTEHRRIADDVTTEAIRSEHQQTITRLTGRTLAGVGTGLAYAVLGLLLYTETMPLAIAGAAVVAMRSAASALSTTMRSVNLLYEHSFYLRFYRQFLAECLARQPLLTGLRAPRDPATIRLTDVSFTYPGKEQPALHRIDLTLRRGEVIALVGENGSGKSTLGRVLTGLYPPSQGTVEWDDTDLATVDSRSVYEQVAIIAQDPAQWPMTAEANIRIGQLNCNGTADQRWATALARSGADVVIESLPDRHHTILSRQFRNGHDLSGGQWQRIGVARGIYRQEATILVADEPTAALDARAEATVFDGILHATRTSNGTHSSKTTILVTHRLANIRHADRIIVLDRGRIAETGTHHELLEANGLYAELYSIQARAYRSAPSCNKCSPAAAQDSV